MPPTIPLLCKEGRGEVEAFIVIRQSQRQIEANRLAEWGQNFASLCSIEYTLADMTVIFIP